MYGSLAPVRKPGTCTKAWHLYGSLAPVRKPGTCTKAWHLYESLAPVRWPGTCTGTCTKAWHLYGGLAPATIWPWWEVAARVRARSWDENFCTGVGTMASPVRAAVQDIKRLRTIS